MSSEEELAARLDEDEATASYAGPARVAWLTYCDDEGQMLYTTVAAGGDPSPWCAAGKELADPASVRVIYDPARMRRYVEAGRAIISELKGEGHGWAEHEPAYYAGLDYAVRSLNGVYDESWARRAFCALTAFAACGESSGPSDLDSPSCRRMPSRRRACWADRKSTRLNSSHLGISYAVF